MNDGGIDAAFVHQDDGLLRGEVRDLPMRQVAWQAGSPQVNLGVYYLHRKSPILRLQTLSRQSRRDGLTVSTRLLPQAVPGSAAAT
jgi:hypothetical protein